jgi:estrogen-related receptor beta like 1
MTLVGEYKTLQDRVKTVTDDHSSTSQAVSDLTNELANVTEQLEEVRGQMDDRGSSMTDTTPVVRIRNALAKIKEEVKTMELRIGVVSHTLMQSKMKAKGGVGMADVSRDESFDMEDDASDMGSEF